VQTHFKEVFIAVIGELAFQVLGMDGRQEIHKLQSLFLAEPGKELLDNLHELVNGKLSQLFFERTDLW
jgi:hypothetical protein